ncbi:hypothetical protein HK101_008758 [Irineochytrium annulatum]|nr:hypothetical protein HK101_008758 [Irineochytrium annulatum]
MVATSATASAALKKAKQPSRKGKKAWVKNIDISGIEDSLDQLRTEERLGGKLHTSTNDKLFVIDTKGDEKARNARKNKTLRIDDILNARSSIAAPPIPGRRLNTVVVARRPGGKVKVASKAVTTRIKEMAKNLQRRGGMQTKAVARRNVGIDRADLWAVSTVSQPDEDDYLAPVKIKAVKKPKTLTATVIKGHVVPQVRVAHSGASYNPSFGDHQDLLQDALDVELEKEKAKTKINNKLSYPPELDLLDDEVFFDSDEEDEEGDEAKSDAQEVALPKIEAQKLRKTKQQRRKEQKAAAREAIEAAAKGLKKLDKDLDMLNVIQRDILKEEKAAEARRKDQLHKVLERQHDPVRRKIGPKRFEKGLLELKLSEELKQGLLSLKPEGNLVKDRFLSMQERALIEPRLPVALKVQKQKRKAKEYEWHDYKRFDAIPKRS